MENFFERKMDLEVGPGNREVACDVVMGGVGGCVFVLVFDKVKVPPYNKEGGGGMAFWRAASWTALATKLEESR